MAEHIIKVLERSELKRFHVLIFSLSFLAYAFTAMDVMLISVLIKSIGTEFSLTLVQLGLLGSSGYVGMFFGALLIGLISDKIGRKKVLILTIAIYSIFTGLCGFATDFYSLIIIRTVAGFGLGGALPIPGLYISEYIPIKYRGRLTGLVETSWVWGVLLGLALSFFVLPDYGWRNTFFIGFLPLLLVPSILIIMPESIRYLTMKGKIQDALSVLRRYSLIPEATKIKVDTQLAKQERKIGIKLLFTPEFFQKTIVLFILWAALVYTYHGIFLWLPTFYAESFFSEKQAIMWTIIVTLAQIPGYYVAALSLDNLGRKHVLFIFLTGASVGCVLLSLFHFSAFYVLIASVVIAFFNLGAWSGLYAYTPEMYPTEYRGTGSGAAASIGRLAGIIAPTATGYIYSLGGLNTTFLVFFLVHLIAALVVITLGVETKGKPLTEVTTA